MKYNADEVLQMAERIEINAAEFYTKAADLHAAKTDVAFLRALARMEYEHRDTFAAIRKRLPAGSRTAPEDYPYLKATFFLNQTADVMGGEGTLSQAQPLTAADSLADIVRKGIGFEQKAILFYLGLRDLVADERGKADVDTVIEMEKQHLVELVSYLERLQKKG